MNRIAFLIPVVFAASAFAQGGGIPLNPAVTQATIAETICVRGYTATVRPPVSYTNRIKKQRMAEMGLPLELISDFQLDHKLPLSLGGSPTDPRNLVLQDVDEAHFKDEVERCLPATVCAGAVSLAQAQQAMWTDWRKARSLCTVRPYWSE